jgi:transposase-like protein
MSQAENGKPNAEGTSTEVVAKAERRQYTAEYKLSILQETEACSRPGEIGAILRREGLYSQILGKWRNQRESGSLAGLSQQRRGPKVDAQAVELARLQRENKRLVEKLKRAELIMDVQKKVAQMLGLTLTDNNLDEEA